MAHPATPPTPERAAAPLLVAGALLVVYVVWGSTYLAIRVVVEEADPLLAMGQRYLVAAALLGLVLALRGGWARLRLTGREVVGCGVLGLLLPLLGNGMVSVAESRGATSGFVALLIAVTPLAIVVMRSLGGDVPRPLTLAGVLCGFAGLALLVAFGRGGGGDPVPLGPALLALFAGVCWALGSFLQPRLWLPRDAFVIAVYEMLLGGVLMSVVALAVGERLTFDYSSRIWLSWGYLVVLGTVVAFTAYVWLLANAPISLVATYAYVNPVVAVVLGWLVLDEHVSTTTLVGGAVVVGSVAVVIGAERRPRPIASE